MNIPKLPEKPIYDLLPQTEREFRAGYEAAFIRFDRWYSSLEKWHKRVFEGAIEFSLTQTAMGRFREWTDSGMLGTLEPTHKALLVQITPIKEETAESLLKDIIAAWDDRFQRFNHDLVIDKAKAFLERQKK